VIAMRMRRADDDDSVNRRIRDQLFRVGVRFRHVELRRHVARQLLVHVGDRHQPRRRNPRAQVARVDAAEASHSDETNVHPGHLLDVLLCDQFDADPGVRLERFVLDRMHRVLDAATAISSGNCATDPRIVPSLIACASSTASKPTRDRSVLLAARIASTAPAHHVAAREQRPMSACACSMF
jgi:hypothetical protein